MPSAYDISRLSQAPQNAMQATRRAPGPDRSSRAFTLGLAAMLVAGHAFFATQINAEDAAPNGVIEQQDRQVRDPLEPQQVPGTAEPRRPHTLSDDDCPDFAATLRPLIARSPFNLCAASAERSPISSSMLALLVGAASQW